MNPKAPRSMSALYRCKSRLYEFKVPTNKIFFFIQMPKAFRKPLISSLNPHELIISRLFFPI